MIKTEQEKFVLTMTCPDVAGLVGDVSSLLAENGAFILEANHHMDHDPDMANGRAFLRFSFVNQTASHGVEDWQAIYHPLIARYQANVNIYDIARPMKVMIAVSKFGHCLQDIIHRWKTGILPIEICGVVSNHEDMRSFVEWAGLPFHHLPITRESKPQQEQKIKDLFAGYGAELLVLARYMQILSADMCQEFNEKAINIHHSFLPSFKGARPYSQAHNKGVKIIGATAHYVTTDLDEGPIIEQAVERVDHSVSVEEFVNIGRETETVALTRAVRWHAERRVLLNSTRTVIFK